ncbi:hypothetical protein [Arthrobacter sp. UYCo732]|uniref:hypothetical protein n=1 Tax=Arthrobacter sp. UYCo732 TaxID=3156336 RepID=UPI003394615A
MRLSVRGVAIAAPLSLSFLAIIPAAALAADAPARALELMSIPAFGIVVGALLVILTARIDRRAEPPNHRNRK